MRFLSWLQSFPVSEWVATSDWGFPIVLSLHSVGLAAVVGILVMLDLRVLGFAKPVTFKAFERLMTVAWIGFGINAVSGVLLFMADASRLVTNWPFLAKMVCVVLGAATATWLWRALKPRADTDPDAPGYQVPPAAKLVACGSIALWAGAILFGRIIAYVMDHAILHGGL